MSLVVHSQPRVPEFFVTKGDTALSGYYFFSPIKMSAEGPRSGFFDVILDGQGNLVYSKEYEEGFRAGSLQLHASGYYSYFFDKKFYVMDSLFRPVDTVYCQNGLITDGHELLLLPNGNYALMGYENITMDLSHLFIFKKNNSQGLPNAKVRCGVIQELNRKKEIVFEWHCKDHYRFEDVDTSFIDNLYDIDWTHFNSLEVERDGNYLVSVKHFNEVTKISRSTGKIIWRLGGHRNEFAFLNDSLKFKGQHHVKRTPNRFLTLFDNGTEFGTSHPETAKTYRLDEKAMSITLVWSHIQNKTLSSKSFGSFQTLSNRKALVSYGSRARSGTIFSVVHPNGRAFFEVGSKDSVSTYRAAYYTKLPWHLPLPEIQIESVSESAVVLSAKTDAVAYYWNTGETARSITVHKNGTYFVAIPFGPDGYLYASPVVVESINRNTTKKK